MTRLPKDWRFLRPAWIYALVLSGAPSKASELVRIVLGEISGRHDVVTSRRRRRLFFAKLLREAASLPRVSESDFSGPKELFTFHQLQEPGRSALSLLYFRLFTPEQLADVIGRPEKDLPAILATARAELARKLPETT
jgi:hypothetical protein